MSILGAILLLIGYLLNIGALITIGWVLVGAGVVLLLITAITHRELMGRRYWY